MARKRTGRKPDKIEVFNVSVAQVDRSYKGIKEWRNALRSAESVTNPRRKLLYDLYKEVILDLHVEGVIGKRKLKVSNKTFKFFDSAGKENEEITKLLKKEFFKDMVNDILDSRFWGHSLLFFKELTTEIQDYELIERTNVRPETGEVLAKSYDATGVPYREIPTCSYIIEAGKKKDLGLLLKIAPYVIFKKGNVSDWGLFNQLFGFPFREFSYDGKDPKVKKEIEKIAQSTLTAPYAIMPTNASMKLHESQKGMSNALFKELAVFCDKQMSKAVLHSTLTIDDAGGHYKGNVHENSEAEVTKDDISFVLTVLNTQFIKILENFGFKVTGGNFDIESGDGLSLKDRLDIDKELNQIIDIEPEYFYEKYKIPVPKSGAKLKTKSPVEKKENEKEAQKEEEPKKKSKSKAKQKQNLNKGESLFKRFLNAVSLSNFF
jgi:phage gp29-like protein